MILGHSHTLLQPSLPHRVLVGEKNKICHNVSSLGFLEEQKDEKLASKETKYGKNCKIQDETDNRWNSWGAFKMDENNITALEQKIHFSTSGTMSHV